MNRRDFIKTTASLSAGAVATISASKMAFADPGKLKVLVLGGRDYFGPTLIDLLSSNGHQITHFNRGFTNAHLFKNLTWIKGDREIWDGSGLANLKEHIKNHKYDLVIDTWQKHPWAVVKMVELLKKHIGHYQYISSISVYKDKSSMNINEDYPLTDLTDSPIRLAQQPYGKRKAWAETTLFEELGDKVTTFRSHGMRSDRTPDRIYEPYWPSRFLEGGDILVPKDENHVMQCSDVKSMISFMMKCVEQGLSGPFNIARDTMPFGQYLNELETVTQTAHKKIWIPKDFLAKQKKLGIKVEISPPWSPISLKVI